MVPLAQIGALLRDGLTAWRNVRLADVLFGHLDTTILTLIVLAGLSAGVAVIRVAFGRRPGRAQVGLPALLSWARSSSLPFLRHGALLLALAGLPFFMLALADPYTQLQQQQLSFPGRRIALMIDASASMVAPVSGGAPDRDGEESGDLLYNGRRGRNLHPPAHARQVPGSDRTRGVRRRGLCGDAVHQRLRQHPAEPLARRRLDRVHEVSQPGHDHRYRRRAKRRAVPHVRFSRRTPAM